MDAQSRGANAIVNVRFATSAVSGGAAELFAYGTGSNCSMRRSLGTYHYLLDCYRTVFQFRSNHGVVAYWKLGIRGRIIGKLAAEEKALNDSGAAHQSVTYRRQVEPTTSKLQCWS
jgi:hypothetical protein